jgi:hypothetical protein
MAVLAILEAFPLRLGVALGLEPVDARPDGLLDARVGQRGGGLCRRLRPGFPGRDR